MGQQKKRPVVLDTVPEDYAGPPISLPSSQYKPHKYGSPAVNLEPQRCKCFMSPFSSGFSVLVKLRDRYIKAMNDMAVGGVDFAAVTGYHGWAEYDFTVQHCRSVKDRQMEALPEESVAFRTIKASSTAVVRWPKLKLCSEDSELVVPKLPPSPKYDIRSQIIDSLGGSERIVFRDSLTTSACALKNLGTAIESHMKGGQELTHSPRLIFFVFAATNDNGQL